MISRPSTANVSPPLSTSTPTALFAVEDDSIHQALASYGEVEPVAGHAEVANGRAHPRAVEVVAGHGTDAGGVGVVVVGNIGEAGGPAGAVEGRLRGRPALARLPPGVDGAIGAVVVVAEVLVVLQLAEEGQHVLIAPLGVSPRGPGVVVVGLAAEENLGVDGARATCHLAARHVHRLPAGASLALEVPVVLAVAYELFGDGRVVPDFFGKVVEVWEVAACLEEQDGGGGVLGKPRRQDRASRTGTDDNVVVKHGQPLSDGHAPAARGGPRHEKRGRHVCASVGTGDAPGSGSSNREGRPQVRTPRTR